MKRMERTIPDPSPSAQVTRDLIGLLEKFANHRATCGCFICRNLTDAERQLLTTVLDGVRGT